MIPLEKQCVSLELANKMLIYLVENGLCSSSTEGVVKDSKKVASIPVSPILSD
jgi:hypothetical protein